MPAHVAIIMDGNGRWAQKRLLSRITGHENGAEAVRMVVRTCREVGIPFLTLYAFSAENWKRPRTEVQALMRLLRQIRMQKNYFVHPTVVVDEPVEIGEGTKIWHFKHVNSGAKIGRNCNIGQNVFIDSGAILGNNIKVQNNVSVYSGVILEDDVFCGPSMVFTNVFNPRSFISRKKEFRKTLVGKGATIGANTTVVCGNTIGQYAFIGASSVVTKDIPDHALVYGNPGKVKSVNVLWRSSSDLDGQNVRPAEKNIVNTRWV